MRMRLIAAAIVAISVPALSLNKGLAQSDSPKGDKLQPMAAITLQDLNGKKISTDQFKDKIVILDFWATWCAPCIKEIPLLNRLQEKYKDHGIKVVGVTLASGSAAEVKQFVTPLEMGYSVLLGDDDQAYELNILGFPTTYLVAKDWKLYRKYIGGGPAKAQQIESDLKQLIETKTRP